MKEREYRTCPMAIDTAIETNIYIYYYMSLTLIIINQTFKSKRTLQLLLHVLVQLTTTRNNKRKKLLKIQVWLD